MRILYVSPYPPAQDGIGTYTRLLADGMRKQGHEACVALPRAALNTPPEVIGAITPTRGELVVLRERLAAWAPDVIHLQFAVPAFGMATGALVRSLALLRELGPPVVATLHEVTRDTALLRGAGRFLYRRIARDCDRIIVHTDTAYRVLTGPVGVPAGKVLVIPHLSAQPRSGTSTPEELRTRFDVGDARVLLAFGFIHVDKGLADLARAINILHRSSGGPVENVRVIVAGAVRPRHGLFRIFEARDRFHLALVLRKIRWNQLAPYFVFTGHVPDEDIAGWFRAAEAVVLPYRRTEQSGVAALADAFQVPVLASTAGGLGERYADSRWAFPPRDPGALAEILERFLCAQPEDRATEVRLARSSDLPSIVRATIDAYELAHGDGSGGIRVGKV